MFVQDHEEDSWHAEENLPANMAIEPALPVLITPFSASGTFAYFVAFSVNGYEHGTMPLRALAMHKGEHVRWYVFAGTKDFDAHSPHRHGNTVVINQMRTDVTSLAAMQMVTADMVPDDVGIWLFHCHAWLGAGHLTLKKCQRRHSGLNGPRKSAKGLASIGSRTAPGCLTNRTYWKTPFLSALRG